MDKDNLEKNEAVKYRECWYGRKKEDVGNGEKPKT